MSYVIIKTDGTILTTINDGTINTTSTSIGLPGRLYPGYGQVMDTNFVHVLENFAATTPPNNPLRGQLWCDTSGVTPVLRLCPSNGESNTLNWYTLLTSSGTANISGNNMALTGNVSAGNLTVTGTVSANLVTTDYLTVNVQANIANANITGNANLANVLTSNITTGGIATLGNITGAWTVNGSGTLNGTSGTALWVRTGNLLAAGIKTDNWYYANGTAISFAGTYSNSNVASYLPTYSGLVGAVGSGTTFNGNLLSTGANTTVGTITGNWTLSSGSRINGLSNVDGANITGTVASAQTATTANTVTNPIQSNITSLGTLSSLTSTGLLTGSRVSATVATGTAPFIIQSTTKVANLNADLLDGFDTSTANTPSTVALRDTSGNLSANYIIANGAFLTGLNTSVSQIISGTSNVSVVSSGGNVAVTIGGTANTAVFSSQGLNVAANVSANNISANRLAGSLTTATQPNVTSLGTLAYLDSSGNITAANIIATSGAFYGNGLGIYNVPASSINGQVPTSNYATYAGVLIINAQPNITSVGTLTTLNVAGNINTPGNVNADRFVGNGSGLTNIPSSAIVGQLPTSEFSETAGTVVTNAQPNITSVGTLTSLAVSGSASIGGIANVAGNINITGNALISQNILLSRNLTANFVFVNANVTASNIIASSGIFIGNASGLTSIPGANVIGTVPTATAATTAGTVINPTQSNITSVGTLTSADVTGNITAGNVYANSGKIGASLLTGTLTTALQPNITTVGTLGSLAVTANVTAGNVYANSGIIGASLLTGTLTTAAQLNITSVGTLNGANVNGTVTAVAFTANTGVFTGNGSSLSSLSAGNLTTGTVPVGRLTGTYNINISGVAATATLAGQVTDGTQSNITGLGTLTSLSVSGNANVGNLGTNGLIAAVGNVTGGNLNTGGRLAVTGNANVGNLGSTGSITATNITGNLSGNGAAINSLNGSNVIGAVANATYADSAGLASAVSFIPSGTAMIFVQSTAPTGWTKVTSYDNAALRVVSGAAGSGGSVNFSAAFTNQSVTGNIGSTTLTENQMPTHSHLMATNIKVSSGNAAPFGSTTYLARETDIGGDTEYNLQATYNVPNSLLTSSAGGDAGHTHTFSGTSINLAVKYVDTIIATKN